MKKPLKLILVLMALALVHTIPAQNADTLYHKKHYNFIAYFPAESVRTLDSDTANGHAVFCFGNIKDSIKNGRWLYFYPSGQLLASGRFKNGVKTGKWNYYYTNQLATSVIFKAKDSVTDRIVFDNSGCPAVIDKIKMGATRYSELISGR